MYQYLYMISYNKIVNRWFMNFNEFCDSNKIESKMCSKKDFSKNKNFENFENITQNMQKNTQNTSNFNKNAQNFDEEALKEKIRQYQNMTEDELKKQLLIEGKKQKENGIRRSTS